MNMENMMGGGLSKQAKELLEKGINVVSENIENSEINIKTPTGEVNTVSMKTVQKAREHMPKVNLEVTKEGLAVPPRTPEERNKYNESYEDLSH